MNLNPNYFWFNINACYFPSSFQEIQEKRDQLPSIFQRLVTRYGYLKSMIKKSFSEKSKLIMLDEIWDTYKNHSNKEIVFPLFDSDMEKQKLADSEIKENLSRNPEKEIINIFREENNLDQIIQKFNQDIDQLAQKNISEIKKITDKLSNLKSKGEINLQSKHDPEYILCDSEMSCREKEEYFNYLIKKHKEKIQAYEKKERILSIKEELIELESNCNKNEVLGLCNYDEIKCLVCNDGDYEENDLIVYCEDCQITVHQSCYGILEIPNGDWRCDPCKTLGSEAAQVLECVLCPVQGGAMKVCQIKQNYYNYITKLRNNNISDVSSMASKEKSKKNTFLINKNNSSLNSVIPLTNTPPEKKKNNEHLSDSATTNDNQSQIITTNSFLIEENQNASCNSNELSIPLSCNLNSLLPQLNLKNSSSNCITYNSNKNNSLISTNSIKDNNIWIHLSCALWHSEVDIVEFHKKEGFKSIELIDKSRFLEECSVCRLSNYGPTVKCENEVCNVKFHVECARINHYSFEVTNKKGTLKYYIYCHQHRPQKILKMLNVRKQKRLDDINNFSTLLNRIYNTFEKEKGISLVKPTHVPTRRIQIGDAQNRELKSNDSKVRRLNIKNKNNIISSSLTRGLSISKFKREDKSSLIKQIRNICRKISNCDIIKLIRKPDEIEKDKFDYSLIPESQIKNKLHFKDVTNKFFPWDMIHIRDLSPKDIKSMFLHFIPDEESYERYIYKLTPKKLKLRLKKSLKIKKKINENSNLLESSRQEKREKSSENKLTIIISEDGVEKEVKTYDKEDHTLYCICKQKYIEGVFMIGKK
jgi:hypothetical protein